MFRKEDNLDHFSANGVDSESFMGQDECGCWP